MITLSQLQAICQTVAGRAAVIPYLDPLNRLMSLYGIDNPIRAAAFLAQIAHESGDFTRVSENLNYSADGLANTWASRYAERDAKGAAIKVALNGQLRNKPNALALSLSRNPTAIANNVYANRMGNGSDASGDGWKFRGRGLKQLTGADNYTDCGRDIGVDLCANPDLLLQPAYAVESACWFWKSNGLSAYADKGDFSGLTMRINGGLNGLDQRTAYWQRAQAALKA